ncbi:MAG: hypothetical protein K0Q55_800 [Verrucomicrobia bacterium]|jgi:hypothetical protein|nr:hypothetical protein [Verrucomicrobiota bacterium]
MKRTIASLFLLGGLMLQSAFLASAQAAEGAVSAELVVPPAETYVIGDNIPLYWRFTNRSTNALGFMWEGCCRVNGRLTISREGQEVPPIPPSQALAHMFAKAEVLAPGKARDFESSLSDWVQLPATGTYQLHGRYTGVLDSQRPQVPRGVNLWRDAAITGTNQLSVLSVTDYLKERSERTAKRGLSVELSGALKFPVLGAADWHLRVRNTGGQPRVFRWPTDFSIWIVNAQGVRESRVPSALDGEYAEVTLPPGQQFTQPIRLDYARMEGEPPGKYQIFIDLQKAADGAPRVPSNPLPLFWEFSTNDVAQLVSKAATGSKAGLRNPALKFLRVYLAEFKPQLQAATIPAPETRAVELLEELRLAAELKALVPQPGRKDWGITVKPSGAWELADEKSLILLGAEKAPLENVQRLAQVKRHLGLDLGLVLQPEAKATAATWFATAQALSPVAGELAAPVHLRALPEMTNAVGVVNIRSEAGAANVVILLTRGTDVLQMRAAVKFPDAQNPRALSVFSPGDFKSMRPITAPSQLLELVSDHRLGAPQVQVFCPADTTLAELQHVLAPLWAKVNQVDLVAAP